MVREDPFTVIEGLGARSQAGEICAAKGYNRVLIVTDKVLRDLGYIKAITDSFDKNGITYDVYDDILSDPTKNMVITGRDAGVRLGAKCILALGGGSVMDSSKVMTVGVANPDMSDSSMFAFVQKTSNPPLPLITIPSTAGTGAEITYGAVITDEAKSTKAMVPISGFNLDTVILDPELTLNAPASITGACGIDAFSHSVEGFVSCIPRRGEERMHALNGMKLVFENLPIVMKDPKNKEARLNMCRGALEGGHVINLQAAGYIHSFAHSIGAMYHIPHGVAIGVSMLPVLRGQYEECKERYAEAAALLGLTKTDMTTDQAAEAFLSAVADLLKTAGIPEKCDTIKVEDYPTLIGKIEQDSLFYGVAKDFSPAEIVGILNEISGNEMSAAALMPEKAGPAAMLQDPKVKKALSAVAGVAGLVFLKKKVL